MTRESRIVGGQRERKGEKLVVAVSFGGERGSEIGSRLRAPAPFKGYLVIRILIART